MSYQFMYWFTRLDNLHDIFCIATVIFSVIGVISCLAIIIEQEEWVNHKKAIFLYSIMMFVSVCGATLIPTQKEAAAIYLIPKIVNSGHIGDITKNSVGILEAKMREWAKELDVIEVEGR